MKRPFPIDPVRTAIAIAYRNNRLIADFVLPRVPVGAESFKWWKYDKAERLALVEDSVSRKGLTNEVEFNASEQTDSTEDHGLQDGVPQSDIDNAPEGYDPLDHATEGLADLILLNREVRAAQTLFNPANHGTKKSLANAEKFDNKDADLLSFLLEQLDLPLMRPTALTIGRAEFTQLRTNRSMVAAMHGNSGDRGSLTVQQVAELLELENVFVGEARMNIAKKGKAPEIKRAWSGHAAFTYLDGQADTSNGRMTWGITAQHGDRFAGQWYDKDIGLRGGEVVRVGESVKELVVAPDCGLLLQDVLGYSPA